MSGRVQGWQALSRVGFRVRGNTVWIECLVDTTLSAELALPESVVAAMGLPFLYRTLVTLFDGSTAVVAVHMATIINIDYPREVRVLAMGCYPRLGTYLLDGKELRIQYDPYGTVDFDDLYLSDYYIGQTDPPEDEEIDADDDSEESL